MHHHHIEAGLGAGGYLSSHHGDQWIFAIFFQRQSLEDARHHGARRL
jgi:hypothetical protein